MSSKTTVYPPRHLDLTGQRFGCIVVIARGPNAADGSAQWWVTNSLNVDPTEEYLMARITLWRKRAGSQPRFGRGMQRHHPAVYRSVVNHFKWITDPVGRYHGYEGMPAYDAWNPKHGSQVVVNAVREIIAEIGDKPSRDYNLHIIDRRVGFWPGNLMWIPAVQHKRAEMLNRLIEENHHLKQELADSRLRVSK